MFKVLYMIMYYYINNNSHSVCGKSTKRDGAELRLFLGGEKKLGITRLCVWDYYIDCANISVLQYVSTKTGPPPSLLCVSNRLESFPVQPYSETHTHPVMLHGKKKHKSQRTFRAVCVCDYIEPKEKTKKHTHISYILRSNKRGNDMARGFSLGVE